MLVTTTPYGQGGGDGLSESPTGTQQAQGRAERVLELSEGSLSALHISHAASQELPSRSSGNGHLCPYSSPCSSFSD